MKIVDRYLVLVLFVFIQSLASVPANAEYVNSIGMKMHPVPQGKFIMGSELSELENWDETPVIDISVSLLEGL